MDLQTLRDYRNLLIEISTLEETLADTKASYRAFPIKAVADAVAYVQHLIDLRTAEAEAVVKAIDSLQDYEDPRLHIILRMRFIDGMSAQRIGDRMSYSKEQISILQRKAVEILKRNGDQTDEHRTESN